MGEGYHKARTCRGVVQFQLGLVGFAQLAAHVQAETGALTRGGEEGLEKVLPGGGIHTRPGIADAKPRQAVVIVVAALNAYLNPVTTMVEGVADQVLQDLLQLARIKAHHGIRSDGQFDALSRDSLTEPVASCSRCDVVEIDALCRTGLPA